MRISSASGISLRRRLCGVATWIGRAEFDRVRSLDDANVGDAFREKFLDRLIDKAQGAR